MPHHGGMCDDLDDSDLPGGGDDGPDADPDLDDGEEPTGRPVEILTPAERLL